MSRVVVKAAGGQKIPIQTSKLWDQGMTMMGEENSITKLYLVYLVC